MDRISAVEANIMSLVRIVDDLRKDIEDLKKANRVQAVAMRDLEKRINGNSCK
jgi:regulator of replication initiation timing